MNDPQISEMIIFTDYTGFTESGSFIEDKIVSPGMNIASDMPLAYQMQYLCHE
jgi:hypothetical protein